MKKFTIAYAFLLLALLVPTEARADGPIKVTSMYGPVEIESASGATLVKTSAMPTLDIGDVVRTGPGAQMTLELPDGSYMVVQENTTLTIERFWGSEVKNLLKLIAGKVRFYIQRLGGRPNPYRVDTPTALIAVRGTTFEVQVAGSVTEVLCFDGRVSVESAGLSDREVVLDKGRKTRVEAGEYPMTPVAIDGVFGLPRVMSVVRAEDVPASGNGPVPLIRGAAGDNDRRGRRVDPLSNPNMGTPGLGQEIRRGKLSFPPGGNN